MFPDAELFTLIHVPGSTSPRIEALRITASPLSRLPGAARHYRKLLPLFPAAIERLRLPACDLVLSTSHAVAKAVRPPRGAPPPLLLLHAHALRLGPGRRVPRARAARARPRAPLAAYLRRFDRRTSGPERIHRVVAHLARRRRPHPPRLGPRRLRRVPAASSVERFAPRAAPPGRLLPSRRRLRPLQARGPRARGLRGARPAAPRGRRRPLAPRGSRPRRRRTCASSAASATPSSPTSTRAAARSSTRRTRTSASSRVEAQAAGRPVIALGRGGATETVIAASTPPAAALRRASSSRRRRPTHSPRPCDASRRERSALRPAGDPRARRALPRGALPGEIGAEIEAVLS